MLENLQATKTVKEINNIFNLVSQTRTYNKWMRTQEPLNSMWTPSAQLHLYLIYVTNHRGRFPSQPKARQRSLNTDDLCFWERAVGCQTHSRLCEMAEDVSRGRAGVDGGWVCGALSAGWGMLFACDVVEHLEEMIGQSAINRRSRSPAARAPCGAARRRRWGRGGLFFFRK